MAFSWADVSEEDEASSVACINGVTLRHMVHVRGQPIYGRCLHVRSIVNLGVRW